MTPVAIVEKPVVMSATISLCVIFGNAWFNDESRLVLTKKNIGSAGQSSPLPLVRIVFIMIPGHGGDDPLQDTPVVKQRGRAWRSG